jgi:hypothetical protein
MTIVSWLLNSVGLVTGLIGALMMARYPLEAPRFDVNGGRIGSWVGESTPEGKRAYEEYAWRSKCGPYLLAFGFLLQFVSAMQQL